MSYDPYYNPEKFGLTTIGEVQWDDDCYGFDLTVVWKHEDGSFYWASDSGCSCPSPFEDYTSLESLESGTKWDALRAIQDRSDNYANGTYWTGNNDYAAPQVADLCAKIVSAL